MENSSSIIATPGIQPHQIVSREAWIKAHTQHRERELELTRFREKISQERRDLPWVQITENYVFDGPGGQVSLADLFDGRSQLFVYHFMFDPAWEEGCTGCSFVADHVDDSRIHFEQADLSFAAISRAPIEKLEAFKKRMGWTFNWVSSFHNNFNYDFHVSYRQEDLDKGPVYHDFKMRNIRSKEHPAASIFIKDEAGNIYHTFSTFSRGVEILLGAFNFLDWVPKGRNEPGDIMAWVKHHDKYNNANDAAKTCCH